MWLKRLALIKKAAHGARLLDIGAGIGTFLSLARDTLACKVTGTEVSSMAVRVAQERYGIALLFGRVEDLQLPNGSFDIVTLWHVLEHLPSPGQTLDLCYHLLANGGWLAIAVPNDDDARWWLVRRKAQLMRRQPPFRYEVPRPHQEVHLGQFTSQVLIGALRSRGFVVELLTIDDHYPQPSIRSDTLVRAYRLANLLTGFNFGQTIFVLARKGASNRS